MSLPSKPASLAAGLGGGWLGDQKGGQSGPSDICDSSPGTFLEVIGDILDVSNSQRIELRL